MEPQMSEDERGSVSRPKSSALIRVHLGLALLGLLVAGCASNAKKPTTRPATTAERQDAAMKDPFGYSPNMDQVEGSGGVGNYDRDGMRKDLDHVLNP